MFEVCAHDQKKNIGLILVTGFAVCYFCFACCLGRSKERSVRGDRTYDGANNSPYGGVCKFSLVPFCLNWDRNRYILPWGVSQHRFTSCDHLVVMFENISNAFKQNIVNYGQMCMRHGAGIGHSEQQLAASWMSKGLSLSTGKTFLLSMSSKLVLGSAHYPVQLVQGSLSPKR